MRKLLYLICFVLMLVSLPASAALVTLTANDAMGTTSFNTAGKWSDLLAPSAGNDYSTVGYLLRSPTVAGDFTFLGDSLTVGGGTGPPATPQPFLTDGSVNNNSLIFKAANINLTVNNLILDAGTIRDGLGTGQACSMNGNISVTDNGGGFAAQCYFSVNSAISGSGTIYIADNGSGEEGRTVIFTSGLNTYTSSVKLLSKSDAGHSRWTLSSTGLMNFVIGDSGVNNSIFGTGTATLAGKFNFDLTGAGTTLGDSWAIVSTTAKSFSDTFSINGFHEVGSLGFWNDSANGVVYQFSESGGTLTVVPEPATMVLLGLGSLALLRRRK